MRRMLVYDRYDTPIGEISPNDVFSCVQKEEINGEHSLEITTTAILQQGWRILTLSDTGVWREHVVYGTDALHDSGKRPFGTYYCVWSVMPDLMGTRISSMPGVSDPVRAGVALAAALAGTSRWTVGTVTNTTSGGASFYDTDGWSAMSTLLDVWGGEIDVTIGVDLSGVISRAVDLYRKQGENTPTRRFDFGADLLSIRRKYADGPLYCRITPRGKGEATDTGGYGRKITIEDVNDGKDYLVNDDMVDAAKLPDGSGGWEYPTKEIENAECETPADLLDWAESVLEEETAPQVTYEVDVLQLSAEGVDMHGVALGDAVQVVDRKFGDGVRISGRVVSQTLNLLDESDVQLTIGRLDGGLAGMFGGIGAQLSKVTSLVQSINGGTMSAADYLSSLIDRMNAEINATGGYSYIVPGMGFVTYSVAVSDPAVGAEAKAAVASGNGAVVEIRGGTIRIANSLTSSGDWDWKTVFTSGHIAAELVTAVNVTAGLIQSADGESYWNLDSGVMNLVGSLSLKIDGFNKYETVYAEMGTSTTADTSGKSDTYRGLKIHSVDTKNPKTGEINIGVSSTATSYTDSDGVKTTFRAGEISSAGLLYIKGGVSDVYESNYHPSIVEISPISMQADAHYGNYWHRIQLLNNFFRVMGYNGSNLIEIIRCYCTTSDTVATVSVYRNLKVGGNFTVTGTKSRRASTEDYGDRLLYALESPSPMFADFGGGALDEDGMCIVSVDDIFAQTVRTDHAYRAFVQSEGEARVERKERAYFIVRGTPGAAFDWMVVADQAGFENTRLEDMTTEEAIGSVAYDYGGIDEAYEDELAYASSLEKLLME